MLRTPTRIAVALVLLLAPLACLGKDLPYGTNQPMPWNWVPPSFAAIGQRAAFHTDFTFDRSMLQLAGYFVGDADPNARAAIAKLNGISVHSYHFAAPGLYDPAALDLIRRQYEAAGWRHLVAAHAKGDPFDAGQTDLWINFAHMDVTGMMLLFSGPRDLNLIAFDGDISTIDLLHLRGHFGIPRFSGDGFTPPGKSSPARPPYTAPAPAPAVPDEGPSQYPGSIGIGPPGSVEAAPPPPTPPGN
ncbi:MAG: hypothetical protein WA510_22240 [Acidobacteriaceae bacterium]